MIPAQSFAAPAKLNLFLRIVGKREDGYHELETAFTFIDLSDEITIDVHAGHAIARLDGLEQVEPIQDLAVQAALALQYFTGCRQGADIRVRKRIPCGAGLGGGSSDAATVLLALNQLWGTGLNRAELQKIGSTLGADVPFFLFGQSAYAAGIGDILTPLPLKERWYLVATPKVLAATAAVFTSIPLTAVAEPLKIAASAEQRSAVTALSALLDSLPNRTALAASEELRAGRPSGLLEAALGDLPNDLEPSACYLYPEIASVLHALQQFGPAKMTGSGASVFLVFDQLEEAQLARQLLPPDLQACVVRGYNRHPHYSLCPD